MQTAVEPEPRFITTPIYYVNGRPHIGHVYTSLSCDVVARFSRLDGHEVLFLTGTDEHGQKVEQSAQAAGETPQELADRVSDVFRSLLPLYDFSCDQFIRTTEARHKAAAQALWSKLYSSGDIYLGEYEGWYAVRDEAFYTEDELVDGKAPTGAEVEWVAETSYFFRLSRFQQQLEEHIKANPDFIKPLSRRNEVLSFMKDGLRDLSISRTTFSWGIPVPEGEGETGSAGDAKHIMYVWLDALTNYISAVGYPDVESAEFQRFWPASVHMVGKDILRFHAIYWPAFLLAAGLPLPRRIFAHGWWMSDGQKMSKSLGNVIDPFDLIERYGTDPVRYFLVDEVAFGGDGDFSHPKLVQSVNSKLANELGNLAYRSISFAYKQCGQTVPTPGALTAEDEAMLSTALDTLPILRGHVDSLALHRYTQAVSTVAQDANRYIDVQAPWSLKKSDPDRMQTVLWVLLETLRRIGIMYQPVVPSVSAKLLDQLGVPADRRNFVNLGAADALVGGAPLPEPSIITPRFELPVEVSESDEPAAASLTEAELTDLVAAIGAQGEAVRALKASGDKEAIDEAIAELLVLKAKLPADHELNAKPKKKKKKKAPAVG